MTRGPGWTNREIRCLVQLRGEGLSFAAISEQIAGRSAAACQTRYYLELVRQRAAQGLPAARRHLAAKLLRAAQVQAALTPAVKSPPIAMVPVPPPVREIPPPSGVAVPTAVLRVDAELRARIERQGLTAGLLGDPLPGRSALDKKRAGDA